MEEMSNSTLRLRELGCGGSFSFSCSDSDLNFSSALSHFTDDVGDDVVEADDSSDVDDEESYIEIALDHHHHHPKATHEDCDGDRSDHVDYLRISFSSSFPFPDFSNHTTNPNTQDDTNIVSDTTTDPDAVVTQAAASSSTTPISASSSTSLEDFGGSDHDVRTKRLKLPAVNRIVNTLFFSLWSSSDTTAKKASGAEEHYSIRHPQSHVDNDDFVQSRYVVNFLLIFFNFLLIFWQNIL